LFPFLSADIAQMSRIRAGAILDALLLTLLVGAQAQDERAPIPDSFGPLTSERPSAEPTSLLRGGRVLSSVVDEAPPAAQSGENGTLLEEDRPDTYPDESTGPDEDGPYEEEPDDQEANHPRTVTNTSPGLQAAAVSGWSTWGRSFCESHQVGYWCNGYTRVRCCRKRWGFVKCGTTIRSTACGWHGAGWQAGGPWHIHPGWRESSFCRARHVGFFCYNRHVVHCCNDYGHFVDCSTSSETSWQC